MDLNFVYLVHLEKQMAFLGGWENYGNVKYMEFSLLLSDLNHGCVCMFSHLVSWQCEILDS